MSSQHKPSRRRQVYFALGAFVFLAYFLPLSILYAFQRHMIYLPHTKAVGAPASYGVPQMKVVEVHTEDGLTLHDWFVPPKRKDDIVIVLFHGSFENIGDIAGLANAFKDRGYGFFFCEYRGFGGSPGDPSEEGVYADARAALKWLRDGGYQQKQLLYWGASLGTGIAVQMAAENAPGYLVLQSPYSNLVDVASNRYFMFPVRQLLEDHFDSLGKIGKVKAPLLVVHGTDDRTVPIEFARQLFAAANQPKIFYTLHGAGHLGLYGYVVEILLNWLDKQRPAAHRR